MAATLGSELAAPESPLPLAPRFGPVTAGFGPVVTHSVMKSAQDLSILLSGQAPFCKGNDVVDLALVGRYLAIAVGTEAVAQFDRSARGPGEEPRRGRALDPLSRGEDNPLEGGLVDPRQK